MVAICVILVWLLAANSDDVDLEVKLHRSVFYWNKIRAH